MRLDPNVCANLPAERVRSISTVVSGKTDRQTGRQNLLDFCFDVLCFAFEVVVSDVADTHTQCTFLDVDRLFALEACPNFV